MHVGVFLSQEVELPHDAGLPHACGGASWDFVIMLASKPSSPHACAVVVPAPSRVQRLYPCGLL